MKRITILFIIINLILSAYFIDTWSNAQNNSRGLPIFCLFENGHLYFDKYQDKTCDKCIVNGHVYSDKAPLQLLTVFPFYGITHLFTGNSLITVYLLGSIICGVLPFLLIVYLSYKRVFIDDGTEFSLKHILLVMLPWYGSFLFVFAGTFFGHLFAGALMLLSYLQLKKKNYYLLGLFAGLSIASEYTVAIFPLIWCVQLYLREIKIKTILKIGLGILPSILLILINNYLITGNPLELPYQYVSDDFIGMKKHFGFGMPNLDAIIGLSFSPFRGIFIYMPILLLVLFVFLKKVRVNSIDSLVNNPLIVPSIIYFLVISGYYMWWGGWSYGPRHLTVIAILVTYEGIPYLIKNGYNKVVFWILISFGLITAFIARCTEQYSLPTSIKNPIKEVMIPKFMDLELNDNNVLSLMFGLDNMVAAIVWVIVFVSFVILLRMKTQTR